MTIVPNCLIDDIVVSETSMLLLPSADTWNDPKHGAIIEKASEFLSLDATVCAICGATAALANFGLLDKRPHTSNGPGFLEMVSPGYKGQSFYIDKPSVADNNLITASSTGALRVIAATTWEITHSIATIKLSIIFCLQYCRTKSYRNIIYILISHFFSKFLFVYMLCKVTNHLECY